MPRLAGSSSCLISWRTSWTLMASSAPTWAQVRISGGLACRRCPAASAVGGGAPALGCRWLRCQARRFERRPADPALLQRQVFQPPVDVGGQPERDPTRAQTRRRGRSPRSYRRCMAGQLRLASRATWLRVACRPVATTTGTETPVPADDRGPSATRVAASTRPARLTPFSTTPTPGPDIKAPRG